MILSTVSSSTDADDASFIQDVESTFGVDYQSRIQHATTEPQPSEEGYFLVSIAELGEFVLSPTILDYRSAEDYSVSGRIFVDTDNPDNPAEGPTGPRGPVEPCSIGWLFLTVEEGHAHGSIQTMGGDFDFYNDGQEGPAYMFYRSSDELSSCAHDLSDGEGESTDPEPPKIEDSSSLESRSGDETCTVDILYIVVGGQTTNSAVVEQWARDRTAELSTALVNSEVECLEVNIVGIEHNNSIFQSILQPLGDLDVFSSNTISQHLREQSGADLVIYLTPNNYALGDLNVFGASSAIGAYLDPEDGGHMVVSIVSGRDRYVVAHEFGHNMGCRHENNDGTDWTPVNDVVSARARNNGNPFDIAHTIVHNPAGGAVPFFSNPDVTTGSFVTGTARRDNAAQLDNNACVIAEFREIETISGVLDGPVSGTVGSFHTWNARISGCVPSSFHWSTSLNGINYSTVANSSGSFGTVLPLTHFFYIRVTVVCANGERITLNKRVDVNSPSPNPCGPSVNLIRSTDSPVNQYELSVSVQNNLARATYENPTEKVIWKISTITGNVLQNNETIGADHSIEYEFDGPSNLIVISAIAEDGHVESKIISK